MSSLQLLVPNISFVDWYIIDFAKASKFLLECGFMVMALLVFDVTSDSLHMALADAERAITILPTERIELTILLVDPLAGIGFHNPDGIAHRHGLVEDKQDVNMVSGSTHTKGRRMMLVEDLRNVCVNLLQVSLRNRICTTLGREHKVAI